MMRSRRQQPGLGIMLLGLQMAQVGFDRIPPVTLTTIGAQVAIYLKLLDIKWPSLGEVCISPITVWYRESYTRIILAAFFHADEWHLYYNMASFLWKGITLEKRLGSGYFIYMIAVFTVLCNVTTVGLAMLAEHLLHDPSYLSQCAVGFSGVIFALKVVTTHMLPPGMTYIMGFIPVHSRLACWAELVVIQLMVPNASFVGHLAGILIGTAYCKGPLKTIMNMFVQRAPSYTYMSAPTGQRGYTTGTAQNRGGQARQTHNYNTTSGNRPDYTGGLSEEEQVRRAMENSLNETTDNRRRNNPTAPTYNNRDASTPPYPTAPPSEDSSRLYPDLSQYNTQGQSRGRSSNAGDQSNPQGQSGGQSSNRGDHQRTKTSIDQDELRRRRLNKFS